MMSDDGADALSGAGDSQNVHDVDLEREGVRKLLDCDEKLFRDVALREWHAIDSLSPRAKHSNSAVHPSKSMKQRSATDSAIKSDSFVTGWFPDKARQLRKVRKEHTTKTKDGIAKEHHLKDRYWRDSKDKNTLDKYVFKHYRDTRKYMEQYRREHSCGATIHITKRVLSPRATDTLKYFPRKVQVYQVYSPSHAGSKESVGGEALQRGYHSNREPKMEPIENGHTVETVRRLNTEVRSEASVKHGRSASQQSYTTDPTVVFKYKLAPHYVQNMLEQHQHLQKQKSNSRGRQHVGKGSSVCSSELCLNGTASPVFDGTGLSQGLPLSESEIRGRQFSAKQSLLSREGGTVSLAPTQVTISPLPSVPVIVGQTSNQTPISALAEKVVVNPHYKGSPPVLPGGGLKTLDNLTNLTTGDKQAEQSSDSDVSLSQLSMKCQQEKTGWGEMEVPSLSHQLGSGLQNVGGREQPGCTVSKQGPDLHPDIEKMLFIPKEKAIQHIKEGRPMLVKFMNEEGALRQALVDLKGDDPDGDLANYDYLGGYAPRDNDDAKEQLSHEARSERRSSSVTIPSDERKRQVRSAQEQSVRRANKSGEKCSLKRGSKSCNLSQPKPPPVPFFKFWGGSLPPEARCHAKRDTKGREGSGNTHKSSQSNALACFDDMRDDTSAVGQAGRKKSARKSARKTGARKTSPAIASGLLFDKDLKDFPWRRKVGLLKVISEQNKNQCQRQLYLPARASSLTLPDITEGVSLDTDSSQSTGRKSSPGKRRTSNVSSIGDSLTSQSGRSSVVSGIFAKTSLFNNVFSAKTSKDPCNAAEVELTSLPSNRDHNLGDLHEDRSAMAGSEVGNKDGRLDGHLNTGNHSNLQNRQPDELHVKPLQPKTKLELSFLPEISRADKFLVHND